MGVLLYESRDEMRLYIHGVEKWRADKRYPKAVTLVKEQVGKALSKHGGPLYRARPRVLAPVASHVLRD